MLNTDQLDEASRATLTRILDTDPASRTPEDLAFLNARRDYLTAEQLRSLPDDAKAEDAEAPKRKAKP